jgi:HK97 gp10 family phage protein
MAKGIELKWSGLKEVDDILKNLPKQVQRKILLAGQREVLKPVAKDLETALSSVAGTVTGNLKKSIGIKALRGGKEYNAASLAGVRFGNRYKGFHGRFIEEGTKERKPRKAKMLKFKGKDGQDVFVKSAAPMKRQPFMRPTIERNLPKIEKEYPEALLKAMAKYMKRTIKK